MYQGEAPETYQICNRKQAQGLDIFCFDKSYNQDLTKEE